MDMSLSGLAGIASRPHPQTPSQPEYKGPGNRPDFDDGAKAAKARHDHPLITFAHHHGTTARALVEGLLQAQGGANPGGQIGGSSGAHIAGLIKAHQAAGGDADGDGATDPAGGAGDSDGDAAPTLTPQASLAQSVIQGLAQDASGAAAPSAAQPAQA